MSDENRFILSRGRLIALTDGVFGIVMTILTFQFVVPIVPVSVIDSELPKKLIELWPIFLCHVTSFVILGYFWIIHDRQFHHIKKVDRTFLWISIFYLMFIAVIPFSTQLLGQYINQKIAIITYGLNLIVILSLNYLYWWYATKNYRLVDDNLNFKLITAASRKILIAFIFYTIAIIMSFVNGYFSILLYIITPIYLFIPVERKLR
jgi:uncharacterized membrane protein